MAPLTPRERKLKRRLRALEGGIAAAVAHHGPNTGRTGPQGHVVWIPVLLDGREPIGKFRVARRPPS